MSLLAGSASIIAGSHALIIPVSILLSLTNIGVFFSGIVMEKFKNENKKLYDDNKSLSNEKNEMIRRMTNFEFPQNSNTLTPISTQSTPRMEIIDFNNLYTLNNNPY